MHDNTPPRVPEIEDDDEVEEIQFMHDMPLDDDDEEIEELTLADLDESVSSSDDDLDDWITPERDDAKITFTSHKAPIFSCAMHPTRQLAATGSEDDTVCVWNRTTGEVLYCVNQHKDTVTEVHFNHDGNYLATGDMSGEIFVFKVQEEQPEQTRAQPFLNKIWEYSMGDMSWMRWHRAANVLLAGSENGEIYVFRLPSGDCKILPGQGARCEAGEISHDGKKLFSSYSNGVLKLWDIKTCAVIMEVNAQHPMAHTETVTAVSCANDAPFYVSGGQDCIILFSTNNGPVGAVDTDGPVECIAVSPSSELKLAASGTLSGQIAIWDIAKFTLRAYAEHPEIDDGITKLKWINDYIFVVTTLLGNVHGYDARSGARLFKFCGHAADIYDVCYNQMDNVVLTVSEDKTAKIFQLPNISI